MDDIGTPAGEGWERVIEDMHATGETYREDGYDVVELHPGDVTVVDDGSGFDLVVSGEEFAAVQSMVADASLTETEVFRAVEGGRVYVLVVVRDGASEAALCCPLYYAPDRATSLREYARESGRLFTYVRSLSADDAVAVAFDDPELFFPE
ncbi:DUF7529 family protein [Halomarina ordinaria]|uniref:Restriction endonuclease n=1 Tax=Halomarina ordinaria TaxID=3033939 RepID=A0ABD5U9A4_9EURY|nr:hypothetical protein [Halomarina sp. PSRA2]